MPAHKHRGSSFNFTRVLGIVIGLHIAVGGGSLWLAKTQAGQDFAKVYHIKLFEPPKPPEQAKEEPPPPPPPKVEAPVEAPKAAAPVVASAPAASAPAPTIGGGGGTNWNGKFAGDTFADGPEGAFRASVMGRFRKHYAEPPEQFGPAVLELKVGGTGDVRSYRLVASSGSPRNDQAILEAAAKVKTEGVSTPPESKPRVVTVRFTPSS
jgi:TonB family protein